MLVESNIDLFPTSLNLTVAPERLTADAGPVLENVRPDVPSGRLKRRLGTARVDGIPATATEVVSCLAMRRGDGAMLVFDCDSAGTLRVNVNPCAAWSNADDFGGFKGSAEWLENFVY